MEHKIIKIITEVCCGLVDDDLLSELKDEELDILIERVKSLNVYGIFYKNLLKNKSKNIELFTSLKAEFDRFKAFNELQNIITKQLITEVSKEKIDMIPFKGIYFTNLIYDDLSPRNMGDVDFLINKENLERVEKIIKKLGFKYKREKCTKEWFDENYYRSCLYIKSGVEIEIHWNLFPNENPLSFDIQDVWKYNEKIDFLGIQTRDFDREIHLIYLCAHISYCHFFNHNSFKRLLDIHYFLEKFKINWNKVKALSIKYGMEKFVGITLHFTRNFFKSKIENEVIKQLIDNKTIHLFKQIIDKVKIVFAEIESDPDKIMYMQRLIQFIGMNNKWDYVELLISNKAASGKWIASLYGEEPTSQAVIDKNIEYFQKIIPQYLSLVGETT